jgi:hypothetical protein
MPIAGSGDDATHRNWPVVPADLDRHFELVEETVDGNGQHFRLECRYRVAGDPSLTVHRFRLSWRIPESEFGFPDHDAALVRDAQRKHTATFAEVIRRRLVTQHKRLVETESGLVLEHVDSPGQDGFRG